MALQATSTALVSVSRAFSNAENRIIINGASCERKSRRWLDCAPEIVNVPFSSFRKVRSSRTKELTVGRTLFLSGECHRWKLRLINSHSCLSHSSLPPCIAIGRDRPSADASSHRNWICLRGKIFDIPKSDFVQSGKCRWPDAFNPYFSRQYQRPPSKK